MTVTISDSFTLPCGTPLKNRFCMTAMTALRRYEATGACKAKELVRD